MKANVMAVRLAAVLLALCAALAWVSLSHIDDPVGARRPSLFLEVLPPLCVAGLSKLGLFLAPTARPHGWQYRLAVGALMVPTVAMAVYLGVGHLEEVAVYGVGWLFRIDALWIPVLALYI